MKALDKGVVGRVLRTLAELPPDTELDRAALAAALGVSVKTLRRMEADGAIPPAPPDARPTWFAGRVIAWRQIRAERAEREAVKKTAKLAAKLAG